ncbi:unnamed protein product [Clavelina lepadiformis]|uniref:Uncharacterized protein n=1 Tax=Clavelina lepadiformis TaxID=159417 RepID=A0ABP0GND7_CLALP
MVCTCDNNNFNYVDDDGETPHACTRSVYPISVLGQSSHQTRVDQSLKWKSRNIFPLQSIYEGGRKATT